MKDFTKISPEEITENTFKLIGSDWMLITAGSIDDWNTMTASWGGVGVLWNKNICWCVVRPTRHTYGFMEKSDFFTLSFFDENHRKALEICGSASGRDTDKAVATGLIPMNCGLPETTSFAQARMILECRKLYYHDIDPSHFIDPTIDDSYPLLDYHRMYFGEIVNCWTK